MIHYAPDLAANVLTRPPGPAVVPSECRQGLAQARASASTARSRLEGQLGVIRPEIATQRPPSQRAAVAVETASFNEHGGDRTQESFKGESSPLNEIAEANSVDRKMIVWAKAVWDAAEARLLKLSSNRPQVRLPLW